MASYSTGTVSVTNGSAVVTGSGTLFLANVAAGNAFTVVSSGIVYDIASVDSNTQVTLSAPYQGTTDSGLSYTIHTAFTSPDQFPLLKQGDIETATIISRAINKIQQRFNLVGDAAAISSAGLYASIAAGLADTVDTEYFFVISGSEFILYLNDSGSEVEQLRFASLSVVQQLATDLSTAVDSAETFADNADTSATNAATSETNASTSETNAADSESNAATSASNAATSASAASTSASNAATSEANALEYTTQANYSADIAMSNAHFKGRWEDLTGSLVVPASVSHGGKFYQLLETIADVTADEPPSSNWQEIPVNDAYIVFDGNGNATFTGDITGNGDATFNGNVDAGIGDFDELLVASTDVTQVLVDIEGIAANYVGKRTPTGYTASTLYFDGNDATFENNVGVGDIAPKAPLEVAVNGGNAGTPTAGTIARFTATATVGYASYVEILGGTSGSASLALGDSDNGDQGTISYSNSADVLGFGAGGNYNQFTIGSTGNGLLTGSFTAIGQIVGNDGFVANGENTDFTQAGAIIDYYLDHARITAGSDGGNNRNLIIRANNAGTPNANQIMLYYNGNVGLGVAVPTSKLDVDGAITINSATLNHRTTGDLDVNGIAYYSFQDNSTGSYVERGWVGFGVGDGDIDVKNATAGEVHLSNVGGRKLSTTASGVSVTGEIDTTGNVVAHGTVLSSGANQTRLANNAGHAQLWGMGPDVSTNGTVSLVSSRSDTSNGVASLTATENGVDITGAITATTGVTVASGQDTLANYIEDTYAPTVTCGTSGTITINGSYDTLSYTRTGNTCFVRGYLEVSSVNSPVGDLRISLPITSANYTDLAARSCGSIIFNGSVSKNANDFSPFIDEAISYASIVRLDASTNQFDAASQVQSSTAIIVDISYPV